MRCYFLRGGRIAGVEILPLGLSDEEAIAGDSWLQGARDRSMALRFGIAPASSSAVPLPPNAWGRSAASAAGR